MLIPEFKPGCIFLIFLSHLFPSIIGLYDALLFGFEQVVIDFFEFSQSHHLLHLLIRVHDSYLNFTFYTIIVNVYNKRLELERKNVGAPFSKTYLHGSSCHLDF